jgi:phage gpG-like protein
MAYSEDFVRQGKLLDGEITLRITGLAHLSLHVQNIRQKMGDLSPFWAASEEAFFRSEQAVWARRGWPEPWPPLAASTIARKRGPGILRETDRMYRSVTSHTGDTVYEYSARNVRFGTNVEYAPYHMTGTRRIPARPFIAMVPEVWNALNVTLIRWLLDVNTPPNMGPQGGMPA